MKLDVKPMCPYCDKMLDGMVASDGSAAHPKDGDYSICLYCHGYLEFKTTHYNKLNLRDVEDIKLKEELRSVRKLIKIYGQIKPEISNPTA